MFFTMMIVTSTIPNEKNETIFILKVHYLIKRQFCICLKGVSIHSFRKYFATINIKDTVTNLNKACEYVENYVSKGLDIIVK